MNVQFLCEVTDQQKADVVARLERHYGSARCDVHGEQPRFVVSEVYGDGRFLSSGDVCCDKFQLTLCLEHDREFELQWRMESVTAVQYPVFANRPLDDVGREILLWMDGFAAPWCVAGGWAIDFFLNRQTRPHADIELAVFRQDQRLLQQNFREWVLIKMVAGRPMGWMDGEHLIPPVHEINARHPESRIDVEFLLNERDADHWIYRRDAAIRLPIGQAVIQANGGIPVLAPEVVLLFKSKWPGDKDAADFAAVLPALNRVRREWLRQTISIAEPDHPWLALLE